MAVERPASVLPCDEGEHGLQYVGGVKLARLGVALVGTLPQTPSGAPISPLYARYWGVGHLGEKEKR